MSLARISSPSLYSHLSSSSSSHLLLPHALIPISSLPPRLFNRSLLPISASFSSQTCDPSMETEAPNPYKWKPMCLYYTQGKCTKMDDAMHLEKFNHDILVDLRINSSSLDKLRPQNLDYLLVLDLEGKVEILEFPVVMIDSKSMEFVDSFHRFVRPSKMSEQRIMEYIEGKYGKFGVDRVWHDTALPFIDVLQEFEEWITTHHLWNKEQEGSLNRAAFVTCGNWDVKTKIPEQCRVSKIKLPSYFKEWINLKDIYLNFYNRRATGMMTMMRQLQMLPRGSHHLGIDDCKNIARVLQRMLADGVLMQITARRNSSTPADVKFLFKNRIR
ncbi:putative exonuclease domain-containing protein [Ananas comosus]|uniref:Putative exonuclease domain-containing protein n=1 Tax=Ananas comosus TaxID=4615 RepID=A0A199W445_ANACO|nr:putative exonuclease domain-containing protein [Ananas comosus]